MMDFLRPSPEVIAFLFLKTNIYYALQTGIAVVTLWYTTRTARRFAFVGFAAALVGLLALTLAPHMPPLSPLARALYPVLTPFQGMAWIGLCFAMLLPAAPFARRWSKGLSISNGLLFFIMCGSWMVAYSNI